MINLLVKTNPFCELCLTIPELRKAAQQQDGDSALRASLHNMQADAIRLYITMFQFHGKTLIQSQAIVSDKKF